MTWRVLWISLFLLCLAFASVSCSDECTDAADKLESCNLPSSAAPAGGCTDTSLCEANCINAASCDELREAFAGTPNSYSDCDDACN